MYFLIHAYILGAIYFSWLSFRQMPLANGRHCSHRIWGTR